MAREPDVDDGGDQEHRLTVDGSSPDDSGTDIDSDRTIVEGEELPSARVALSEARIVSAALAYIDEFGLPGLSMRRLGSVLGVEAMSLYRYVAGREALLDAIAGDMTDLLSEDDDVLEQPTGGWQDFVQRLAHGVRRMAITHPKAFPLVASRPPEAPWLRPPLRSLQWVEVFLGGLIDEGFSDDAAVRAYRAFSSFLLGHLLLEVATLGADLGPLDVIEEEFEEALEDLLNRIELIRTEY